MSRELFFRLDISPTEILVDFLKNHENLAILLACDLSGDGEWKSDPKSRVQVLGGI